MNTNLAPTYTRLLGDYWVLWFDVSNCYSVIDTNFKILLDVYLESKSMADFAVCVVQQNATSHPESIAKTLETYLKNCNSSQGETEDTSIAIDTSLRHINVHYRIKGKIVEIFYSSDLVAKTIHPALAHLSVEASKPSDITFDIYIKDRQLYLYNNKHLVCRVPQQEYHRMQGRFTMHLLCFLYQKTEADWLGTFHGSTITDGTSSLLFIGPSGKGKSTLCALLVASGLTLLADDVSPMLAGSQNIYHNPAALSIKKGAFHVLEPLIAGFNELPITQFNKSKGQIKYMPCETPAQDSYPCKGIVIVNYKADAQTQLEPVSIKTLLETLIPESWLSPNPVHAKEFLDWLDTVKFYQLTYSNTESVIQEVSQLFQDLNKNL